MKTVSPRQIWLDRFDAVDRAITYWMARYGMVIMRVGLGIIFFWFGALKLVPGLSPAEDLVRNTIYFIDPDIFLPILAERITRRAISPRLATRSFWIFWLAIGWFRECEDAKPWPDLWPVYAPHAAAALFADAGHGHAHFCAARGSLDQFSLWADD